MDQNAGVNNWYQEYKIKIYYLEQQNSFLKQVLTLKQNTIDKLLAISPSQYRKKTTGCESSDVPTANCSLIEQQCESYPEAAANDADNIEKVKVY